MPPITMAFNGKLNLDTQNFRIPPIDYIEALNITRDARGLGQDKVVTNILGNRIVEYELPAGINKRIGSKEDLIRNKVYYFIWNSNGHNLILFYDRTTDIITKLLESITDTSGIDILAFDPSYRINHIDIIPRDEGDLLFWTDGLNRPLFLNVQEAIDGLYGTDWKIEYITVNRPMGQLAPLCDYADDSTVNINNFRKKLYQFKYLFVYTNFTKSCWSPISKLFAPQNPDDIAKDIDPTKNNRIDVIVQTGNEDCLKIEIAARQSIETTFSDFFLITTLDKAELSIDDNALYTYQFFNDSGYPYIDLKESLLLFSNIPKKAYAQCLPNGNVLAYGAITEGYNFDEILDVDSEVTLVTNPTTSILFILSYQAGRSWVYMFLGDPATGDLITLTLVITHDDQSTDTEIYTYTVLGGDTLTDIVNAFVADVTGSSTFLNAFTHTDSNGTTGIILVPKVGTDIVTGTYGITYASSSSPITNDIDISTYKPRGRYAFGLVYFDEFGITNGVVYQPSSMNLLMPELDTTGGTKPKIPQITFSINHIPPIWAVSFAWVRTTNLTFLQSIPLVSLSTKKDSASQYAYIEITNLQTNQQNYSAYEFTEGDRVRIIGKFVNASAGIVQEYDFPITDLVTNPLINGIVITGDFLKIPYNSVLSSFGSVGNNNYFIEIYTPAPNTNVNQQFFYEFGENYTVLDPGTDIRRHTGQQQNQNPGVAPAIFNFLRGDYYQRTRLYFVNPTTSNTVWIMSQSVSDLYPSQVQSIGRAFIIDADAKETYFPTLIRFGQEYQQDTNINKTNIFFPDDFDEYDRSNGDIRKLFIEGRYLYVFHKFDIGVVPVLTQIVRDTAGNPLEANSDILLNKITYPYKGKYGIGNVPESFAYYNYAKYFVDNNKGVVCRLSQDGIIPLSVLYECNAFFVTNTYAYQEALNNGVAAEGQSYTGNPTIYGCFDFATNRYIVALEEINRYDYLIAKPENAPTAVLAAGGFLPIGVYSYQITFVNSLSQESPVSDTSNSIQTNIGADTINLSNIAISSDPTVVARRIYADLNGDGVFRKAGTINNNIDTTFIDNGRGELQPEPSAATGLVFHQDPYTLTFAETRNETEGFESFISPHPEGMVSIGTLLILFKDGQLWKHDNPVYCNFFGVQYDSSITGVFNDNQLEKKSWQALTQLASDVWECPLIYSNVETYPGQRQETKLIPANFKILEGMPSSAFLRDINSIGGWINGGFMKGSYLVIKFLKQNASELIYLNAIAVRFVDSPLTAVK